MSVVESESAIISNTIFFAITILPFLKEYGSKIGRSQSVVLQLLDVANPKEGRILYANFYSSIALVKNLFKIKMLYCGTLISSRRGVPKDIGNKMKKGEVMGIEQME